MLSTRRIALVVIACGCVACALIPASETGGGERVINVHSDIVVHADSSLTATEIIKVCCTGEEIKRGIYRDFPTVYEDRWGRRYEVGLEVLEVLRDGRQERFHIGPLTDGKRVYIGHKDVFLDAGDYTYVLRYRTTGQLRFLEDHDELYWNVTGNNWAFEIEKASATVQLPAVPIEQIRAYEAYTGPVGARGTDYTVALDSSGAACFSTTRPLAPGEGLTIRVAWSKGYVVEPTALDERMWQELDGKIAQQLREGKWSAASKAFIRELWRDYRLAHIENVRSLDASSIAGELPDIKSYDGYVGRYVRIQNGNERALVEVATTEDGRFLARLESHEIPAVAVNKSIVFTTGDVVHSPIPQLAGAPHAALELFMLVCIDGEYFFLSPGGEPCKRNRVFMAGAK